jgi:2-polyprenyl-6-methoxyphenol hydroxylase-like FAD-dependent oxidoreductase
LSFEDADAAHRYLRKACPRVLDLASPKAITEFAHRPCYHIGQKLQCSQLHGETAVLVGDAAGPFPPIGQGVNAAMEAAMVLSESIASANDPRTGASNYNGQWKPELDAVSWISEKMLFENRLHTLRANLTMKAGINVIGQAKSSQKSYAQVYADAQRFGPLWT